jgi:hypothetical protein
MPPASPRPRRLPKPAEPTKAVTPEDVRQALRQSVPSIFPCLAPLQKAEIGLDLLSGVERADSEQEIADLWASIAGIATAAAGLARRRARRSREALDPGRVTRAIRDAADELPRLAG